MNDQDRWSRWLLERRFGGDTDRQERFMQALYPVRDRVLEGAEISAGEIVLDVGAGDGLIAFGALERVGPNGRVVFGDVSRDLLDHSRALAQELGVLDRCAFVEAPARDLSALADRSVSAVTLRSVLIYEEEKAAAFEEFFRVLRPGGRLSLFEPINRFNLHERPGRFLGYDVSPVADLARKVWAVYERRQPPETDPMFDFDERDLLKLAGAAGFDDLRLDYRASISATPVLSGAPPEWETLLKSSGNPKLPTLDEALEEALSPPEKERLVAHLRPRVEAGERRGREAVAYLTARKSLV